MVTNLLYNNYIPFHLLSVPRQNPAVKKDARVDTNMIMSTVTSILGLIMISTLGTMSVFYMCCKKGLFGSSQPRYVQLQIK